MSRVRSRLTEIEDVLAMNPGKKIAQTLQNAAEGVEDIYADKMDLKRALQGLMKAVEGGDEKEVKAALEAGEAALGSLRI